MSFRARRVTVENNILCLLSLLCIFGLASSISYCSPYQNKYWIVSSYHICFFFGIVILFGVSNRPDGILGFSQGAAATALLLSCLESRPELQQSWRPKFAIMVRIA
jgi:hypothetical protein